MSNISLEGNASGTGTFTIAAPNTSSNFTLTLPQASGTIALGTGLTGVTDSASPFETSLGEGAGGSSTGVNNTFIGFEAGNDNTTGANNVAVGYRALDANTTGFQNVVVGADAGGTGTSSYLTAIGFEAGKANVEATNGNTMVGWKAGVSNTTGVITAVGVASATSNTTGANNTAVGYAALNFNVTGSSNTAVGHGALYGVSGNSFSNNTAVGFQALNANTTGSSNTSVGYQAAVLTTTAVNSVAIGYQALYSQTTAGGLGWNVGVGLGALSGTTTGYYNIGLGGSAGSTLTTGNSNVFIGTFAAASAVGVSNEAVRGGLTGKGANTFYVMGSSGSYNQKNVTTWETTSDQRLKKNIVDNTEGLEKINALRVRNFEYRLPEEITDLPEHTVIERSGVQLGIIAQELQEVCPTCVTEQSTGVLSVSTDEIFWHMVNAIKQLNTKVEALEAQLQAQTQAPASTQEQPPAEPNA